MRALLLSLIFCALTQMGLTAAELHLKNDLTGTQLQHLIEQANAGDTIIIEEKAFLSAPLVIDKPLSILGSHKEASQILVKLEAPLPVGTSALTIQSSGVSIETLSIKHHEDSQMYDCLISCFGAFENIRLYNLNLDVNKKGIYFDYGAGEIESCTFSVLGALAEDMITLCGLIQDISIKNNKIDGNESGLRRCTFIKVRDTDDEGTAPLRGALRIVGNYLAENKNSFINVFFKYMGFHTNKQGISLEGKFNKIHAREAFLFAFDANARLDYFNQIHLEGNTLSTPRSYNGLLHFTAQDTTYPSQWVLSNNLINLFVLKNNVTPYTTAQHVLRPDLEYPDEQKLFALDRSFFKNHTAADLPTTPFVDVQLSDDLKNIIEHSPDSIVRLAPGNHTLSHTIHVPNDLCLVGMGSDPSACTLHISSGWSDTDSPLFSLADNHSTIIRNLAVEPENSSDITNYPKQLLVSSGQSPLILQNTKLSYVTNAVFTTSHDIYINQCTFTALEDPTPTSSAVYLDVNEEAPINYVFCYNTGTHLGASYKDRNFLFINFSRLNLNSLQGPEDASSAPPTKTQLQTYYIYQNELHQPVESFLKMHYTQGHPKTGSNYAFHHYPHPVLQNIYLRKNINIPAQALLTLVNLPGSPLTSSSSEYFPWFFVEDNSLNLQNIPYRGEISCIGGAPFKGEQKIDANLIAFHVYYQAHESLEKLDAFLPLYHESRKDTLALSNLKIEQHFQTLLQTPRVAFLNTAYKDTVFDKQEAARKAAEEAARKAAEDAARKAAEDAARKAAAIAAQATSQPLVSHQPTLLAARESASSLSKQNIPQNLAATPSVTSPQTQTPSQTPPPSQTLPRVQPGKYSPPPRKSLPFHHTSVNVPQGPSKESSDTIPQPQSKYLQGRHPISVPTSVKNIPFSNTNINTQQKNDPIHHSSPKEGIKTKEAKGSTNKESIPLKTKVPVEQQNTKPAPLNPTPAPSNMTVAVNSPNRGVRPRTSGQIHTSSTINTQNARKHTSSTILDPSQKVSEEQFLQTTRNIALEPVTAVSVQTVTHKLPTHEYKYYLIKWTAKTRPGQVFKIYENGKFSTSIPGNSLETYSVSIPKGSSNSPVIEIFPVFGASTGPGTKVQP